MENSSSNFVDIFPCDGQAMKQEDSSASGVETGTDMAESSASVVRSSRDEKPVHYILKIQSFSLLNSAVTRYKTGRFESQIFNAGGYDWKLALYPTGDEKRNGTGHISLYLVLDDPTYLEVKAVFTFLVYDNLKDKYLTVEDGKIRRFSAVKPEWGISQLLPLETFNDSSNGLLVDDCCVFGVDIFVMNCDDVKGEVFSLIKEPEDYDYTWKVQNFSQLEEIYYESKTFGVQNCCWKIRLYPNGDSKAKPGFLSLYLMFDSWEDLPEGSRLYVEYEMAIVSQLGDCEQRRSLSCWFGSGGVEDGGWGSPEFMSLSKLKKPSRGFIWNDSIIIEVGIKVISTFNKIEDSLNTSASESEHSSFS